MATMQKLFPEPPAYELPLSTGNDLVVNFLYKPLLVDEDGPVLDGNGKKQFVEADYPDGAVVKLIIEGGEENTEITAEIVGSMATAFADHSLLDVIKSKKKWRSVVTYVSGIDKVMCNGLTKRYDGDAA